MSKADRLLPYCAHINVLGYIKIYVNIYNCIQSSVGWRKIQTQMKPKLIYGIKRKQEN